MASTVGALDPQAYLSAMTSAAAVLEDHATGLDQLDRPPEPDTVEHPTTRPSGPGSDMSVTLTAAVDAARSCRDFASMCSAMASGADGAASGRAGRSMARLLGGLGEVFANADRIDAHRFALGLEAGAERLAPGDDGRHPGGFTAVANAIADASLTAADRGLDLAGTVIAAAGAGVEELERGPALDARLAERGTVDASAAGLLLVLDVLASVLTGEPLPEPPVEGPAVEDGHTSEATAVHYRVSCELLPEDSGVEAAADLEAQLGALADLDRFEAGPERWIIRLETTSPGSTVECLAAAGRLRELHIAVSPDEHRGLRRSPALGVTG
ncbi:MAG: hypothetical protein M9922_05900 [Microthrixaceae bacterium]|nr:hypothetical protein [Microthrixaceae bacterium]